MILGIVVTVAVALVFFYMYDGQLLWGAILLKLQRQMSKLLFRHQRSRVNKAPNRGFCLIESLIRNGKKFSNTRGGRKTYLYWGFFFLLLQALVVIRNFSTDYFSFFWYCDFTPIIFAALFFWRNDQAIKGLISIGFFMQLAYVFIIVFRLIFNVTLFGFAINFPFTSIYVIPTLIIHLGTMFAFIAAYKVKPKAPSLMYSFVFLVMIYTLVIVSTNPTTSLGGNYNLIYYPELFSRFSFYTEIWVGVAWVTMAVPTHLFQLLVWHISKRRKHKVPQQSLYIESSLSSRV